MLGVHVFCFGWFCPFLPCSLPCCLEPFLSEGAGAGAGAGGGGVWIETIGHGVWWVRWEAKAKGGW